MYYYYDILLNFGNDQDLYDFYEWEEEDALEFVKKIPLFRVNSETILDNLTYQIKYNKDLVELIENKSVIKSSQNTLENLMIISDMQNALALEIDENGLVISRSKLLLGDEENLLEMIFSMKETNFSYEKGKKYIKRNNLRQVDKIKRLIKCELDTLYESKNISKLKYLYYEWFNKSGNTIEDMMEEMQKHLQKDTNEDLQKIYYFIKMSYNK